MAEETAIRVTCPSCGHRMKVPAKHAGRKVRCPGCEAGVAVPAATAGAGPPPTARPRRPAPPADLPPLAAAPASRAYVHDRCGEATEVDGGTFKAIASPVPGIERTVCAECGETFPAGEFRWEDTGEPLPAYYARHAAKVSGTVAAVGRRRVGFAAMGLGAAVGVGLGVLTGAAAGVVPGVLVGLVAAPAGVAAGLAAWAVGSDVMLRSALGVRDVRCLR